jgi:hypothetical protein
MHNPFHASKPVYHLGVTVAFEQFWCLTVSVESFKLLHGTQLLASGRSRPFRCLVRGCIQKFPDWVDNEIYTYNSKHSLRSNTEGYGGRTH